MVTLNKDRQSLYCLVRQKRVVAHPEECVRQHLIGYLIETLNFPRALLAVEKGIDELAKMVGFSGHVPNRRIDLVAFARSDVGGELKPVLLVECKARKVTQDAVDQLLGYNHFLEVPFLALAAEKTFLIFRHHEQNHAYEMIDALRDYRRLFLVPSSPGALALYKTDS